MFKSLRDRFRRASKKAEEELDPELKLDYESFRPEERDSGAVRPESGVVILASTTLGSTGH